MLKRGFLSDCSLYWKSFVSLIFPKTCCACGKVISISENVLCIKCYSELPRTNYHIYKENPVANVFYGRVKLEAATSFIHFIKDSKYSKLMYKFKYEGYKEIGELLGIYFGLNLRESDFFSDIDIIVPVPLHKIKLRNRGYNQSEYIARGISKSMNKNVVCDNLIRSKFTKTQTKMSRIDRWVNVSEKFKVLEPKDFEHKHILLVDDVITTGATIEACAQELLNINGVKVSVVSLAKA